MATKISQFIRLELLAIAIHQHYLKVYKRGLPAELLEKEPEEISWDEIQPYYRRIAMDAGKMDTQPTYISLLPETLIKSYTKLAKKYTQVNDESEPFSDKKNRSTPPIAPEAIITSDEAQTQLLITAATSSVEVTPHKDDPIPVITTTAIISANQTPAETTSSPTLTTDKIRATEPMVEKNELKKNESKKNPVAKKGPKKSRGKK